MKRVEVSEQARRQFFASESAAHKLQRACACARLLVEYATDMAMELPADASRKAFWEELQAACRIRLSQKGLRPSAPPRPAPAPRPPRGRVWVQLYLFDHCVDVTK